MVILLFYRFLYLRNNFHKTEFKDSYKIDNSKSKFFNFNFSKEEVANFQKDGITPIFKLNADSLALIKSEIDKHDLEWDGKILKNKIDNILRIDTSKLKFANAVYKDLDQNHNLLKFSTDPTITNFVSSYLRTQNFIIEHRAWWSFPFDQKEITSVGQDKTVHDGHRLNAQGRYFHYDATAKRSVKLFIYLIDCDSDSGPHCYIKSTHRKRPFSIGFKQLILTSNELSELIVKDERWLTLTGKSGDSFIMDNFGIHRGIKPKNKPRLILQFHYAYHPSSST